MATGSPARTRRGAPAGAARPPGRTPRLVFGGEGGGARLGDRRRPPGHPPRLVLRRHGRGAIAGPEPRQVRGGDAMSYVAPVEEQKFVLRHIVGLEELAGHEAFAEASGDVADAVVDGAGAFA